MARPRKPREDDPWKQRDRFMELVDQKVEEGIPLSEIAKALGLSSTRSLEISYRHDRSRTPKRTTIVKAAQYFGVPQSEIYGDSEPHSEAGMARAFLVSGGMGSDDVEALSDEQVIEAWRVALATAKAVLAK